MLGACGSVGSFDASCASPNEPSDETFSLVMAAGIALPLLEFRFVKNFLGDSSRGFWASFPGSSAVAPPATPMLSFAILAIAGALERQLPPPPSHFMLTFLFSVCGSGAAGVLGALVIGLGSAAVVFGAACCCAVGLSGVFGSGFVGLASVGGAGSGMPGSAGA
jgi:hypothetical protein